MNEWKNIQLLRLNQLGLHPQVLAPPTPVSQFLSHHCPGLAPSQQSSYQLTRECHHPSKEILRVNLHPPYPSGLPNLHRWFSSRLYRGRRCRLESPSQSGIVHQWNPPTDAHSSSFQAEKAKSWMPCKGYHPFHHGLQLSSSTTANHWFRRSAILTKLIRQSSNRRLQPHYLPCRNQS